MNLAKLIRLGGSIVCCLLVLGTFTTYPVSGAILENEQFTIVVDEEESWNGINHQGNLSFYGCDASCQCIYLTGGKVSCRHGRCQTTWQNQDYSYILSASITDPDILDQSPEILTIFRKGQVLTRSQLYPKSFDN